MTKSSRADKKRLSEMLTEVESVTPGDGGDSILGGGGYGNLKLANLIDEALGTPEPEGDPDHIEGKAAAYGKAAQYVSEVRGDISSVADAGLPEVWIGEASSRASDVTRAAGNTAEVMADRFRTASRELSLLSEGIARAQRAHGLGLDALHSARNHLGDSALLAPEEDVRRAKEAAADGIRDLRTGVEEAENAGERAERELDKLASEARAGRLDSDHLSDADRIVLADAAAAGGDREDNEILSANDLERAGVRLDRMSAADRQAYDRLLDDAKSPQERAYLMKALAAGYDLEEIRGFSEAIHPYGDDPVWLQQHLTPVVTASDDSMQDGDQSEKVLFGPQEWTQGPHPTCVVSSTITARAMVDPLYALELTTGGHPGDPEYDNPDAFAERLREEQAEMHAEGGAEPDSGMSIDQGGEAADREISPHTGATYERVDLEGDAQRADALDDIRESVNEGKPVPIGVKGDDSAHQMMVVGQEGDKLQIYNPWGFTTWVSEEDFVNGDISGASSDDLPEPYYLQIPD
ncbi:peptidoglycan-binding protein [Streptomyces sp. JJ36]|uniref:peptidoglycan-binding protein n=1 Tax=Streptomyces sp. JJ36 TaxID=2736645 RepID=UPI001F3A16A6|nr:peptidoglycan-binding protein [Streptomyces sp. JJ36]MCF6524034.1 peptidoglycan-binding protein [Streptomyces sp. JJ36]